MTALQYVLAIVIILVSIAIIALVMLQESKQQGLGAIGGAADSFFGKNKGKTMDAKLAKFTKLFGAIFFVLALVASLLVLFGA
jgi:preprotein translocase subunit SecG